MIAKIKDLSIAVRTWIHVSEYVSSGSDRIQAIKNALVAAERWRKLLEPPTKV